MGDNVIEIAADTSSTSILPCEILSQIFTFLPLEDRVSVRLTCRSWYECCTSVNITKHEKFVFRMDPGVEHIAAVVLRSNHSVVNLEFQHVPVSMLPANVWKVGGPRIRELEFYFCQWDDETIRNILLYCENLTSLVINENDNVSDYKRLRVAYSPRLLNDFIGKGIRRPKLRTLSTFVKFDEYENVLRKVILLHPGIKSFNFTLISDNSWKDLDHDPFAIPLESPTPRIPTPDGCRGSLVSNDGQGFYSSLTSYYVPRLKFFETWPMPTEKNETFNFFRSQKNLEVINLQTMTDAEDLFYIVLENCPRLREFCLNIRRGRMRLRPSEVSRFVTCISKLKFLDLGFELEDSAQVPSVLDLLPDTVKLDLTSLRWRYPCHNSDFCAAIFQRCSSLKHLRLAWSCDTTLKIIFQHLPELQTLALDNVYWCTEFGFSGRTVDGNETGYSIKRLQQLRHLKLIGCEFDLMEKIMLELQLPRLEFLSLHSQWSEHRIQLSEAALNHCASNLPELRVLAIDFQRCNRHLARGCSDCVESTIQLCKRFNKLHRLILPQYWFRREDWEKQMAESVFSACPSLRYMCDCRNSAYLRDPFTGILLFMRHLKFSSGKLFPDNETFDTYGLAVCITSYGIVGRG